MYTLSKAKDEIDTVAKHATEIAEHVMGMADDVNARLERFKTEILATIERKFEELGRTLHGETEAGETSAISDLGAKVSLLQGPATTPKAEDGSDGRGGEGHDGDGHREEHHGDDAHHHDRPHGDPEWTEGHGS